MLNHSKKLLLPAMISAIVAAHTPQIVFAATDTSVNSQSQMIQFNVPAGTLDAALIQFAEQAQLEMAFDGALSVGKQSPGVAGQYSVAAALDKLLSESGLDYRINANNTVTLFAQILGEQTKVNKIIIKGEKMQRGLADTASSVVVFDDEELEKYGSINNVLGNVANVISSETSNSAPTIRGIDGTGPARGAIAFFAGSRTRLGMLIDGRPAEFNELVFGDNSMWDVEQVEMFRGPQSTLNGRNSIAGAVVITTKNPTFEEEAAVRVTAGNLNARQVATMYSAPINDDFAFRIAAEHSQRDSFLDYEPFAAEKDSGEFHSTNVRAKLLFQPKDNPDFSHLITLNHNDHLGVQGEHVAYPFSDKRASTATAAMFNPKSTSLVMDTNWVLNDDFTFENTLIYSDIDVKRTVEAIGTGNVDIDASSWLWEPRLRFTGSDEFYGFIGFHTYVSDRDEFIDIRDSSYEDETRNYALFGEAVWALNAQTDLTFGGRWERETRKRLGGTPPVFDVDLDESYSAFSPKLSLSYAATPEWTVGGLVSKGYNAGGAGVTFEAPFQDYAYDEETVINYELFTRGELLDGQLQLSANLFFSDYDDMQIPLSMGGVVGNADEAESYGLEVGARWFPSTQLELFADLGLTKTKVSRFTDGLAIEGNELPRAPSLSGNLGFNYNTGNGWDVAGNTFFSQGYYSDVANNDLGKIDSYWAANLQAGYTYRDYRFFGFIKNITDEDNTTQFVTLGADEANSTAIIQHPRTWGLGVEMSF